MGFNKLRENAELKAYENNELFAALHYLRDSQEAAVIELLYGLDCRDFVEKEPKKYSEVANELGMTEEQVECVERSAIDNLINILNIMTLWIDPPEVFDLYEEEKGDPNYIYALEIEGVREILHRFTVSEQNIISQLYGMEDGVPLTCEKVAKMNDVSEDSVQQIKENVAKGLKASLIIYSLIDKEEAKQEGKISSFALRQSTIEDYMGILTEREIKIIRLLYGLGGEKEKSYQEVADVFGISVRRVIWLEEKVAKKIKNARIVY